jgi:hypothetical protein
MKKNIYVLIALVGALAWTGCMKVEEELIDHIPEEPIAAAVDSVWTVTLQAVKKDAPDTKGLAIEGEEATTTVLKSVWKAGEEVKVFLESACIGTLTATPDAEDAHKATLSGTVTTTSLVEGTSTITLLTPRETWDYTGQVGTLLEAAGSIEKMYHYTAATGVTVTTVDTENNTIATDNATFVNQQSIFRLSFRYKKPDETKTAIVAKSVTISSERGKLVQSQSVNGTTVTEGPISVTLGTPSSAPFFVALRNGDETNAEALTFTVIDADGVTYRGSKTIPAEYKRSGSFVSAKNASLDQRLQLAQSTTGVDTVL